MLRATIICLLVVCAFAKAGKAPRVKSNGQSSNYNAPSQFVTINGKEYFFSSAAFVNWAEAAMLCADMNMTLISFETTAEHTAVFEYIAAGVGVEDVWRHASGQRLATATAVEDWTWVGSGAAFTDTNWGPGQPSNSLGIDDCTSFLVDFGGWDDDACGEWLMSYACEE